MEEEEVIEEPKAENMIDSASKAAERLEAANAKNEELISRQEELAARAKLEGKSEAGSVPEKPKELTDTEYAEALQRGEVNPLKEDGFL